MTTLADNSTPEILNSFQMKPSKPSPSKKSKMESAENSEDDDDYEPALDIKMRTPESRTRKRPPISYRVGDIFSGLAAHKTSDSEVDGQERSSSSASASTSGSSSDKLPLNFELETDAAVIARRKKQIEYGKNTTAYEAYVKSIPRENRELHDPKTPNIRRKYSRRAWDGLIKQWKKKLHCWSNVHSNESSEVSSEHGRHFSETESFTSEEPEDRKVPNSELIEEEHNGQIGTHLKIEVKEEPTEKPSVKVEKHEASWSEQVEDYLNDNQYNEEDSEDDDGVVVKV